MENFTFKFGKYAGKTYEWVSENAPSYIVWAEENAPNLLKPVNIHSKPIQKKEVTFRNETIQSIVPNLNFLNEGPYDFRKLFFNKINYNRESENNIDEWGF